MKHLVNSLIKYISLFLIVVAAVLPSMTYAVEINSKCGQGSVNGVPRICNSLAQNNGNPAIGIIGSTIKVLSVIIGITAIVTILVSAARMILANGDAQSFGNARSAILYAFVGIIVAIFAQLIVVFVLDKIK